MNILNILENNRVLGDHFTHVNMINPKGKYQISKNIIESFWNLYCTDIINEEKIEYGIAENPQLYLPILVDVDIKLEYSEDKDFTKLYTDYQIENVIRNYQDVLKNILVDCKPENLYCFLLEKPSYRVNIGEKIYVKNGFHLMFINTFIHRNDHINHLLPRVKKNINKDMTFKSLGFEKSGDLIDTGYIKSPWLLYGSKKHEGMDSYKLTKIYNDERDIISLEDALKNHKIYTSDEYEINHNENINFYLPRILSIIPWNRPISELRSDIPLPIRIDNSSEKKKVFKTQNLSEILTKAKTLLNIISEQRAEIYSDWIQIGWAIFNISEGSIEGLELWLEFSSRCPEKFDQSFCTNLWEKMEMRNITLGTLHHFAKIDNFTEYNKFTETCAKKYINEDNIINCSHNDLAKACYEKCGTEFVCASIVNNLWYQYKNHRWNKIEDGIFLRKKLSDDFVLKFELIAKEIMVNMSRNAEPNQKDMFLQKHKHVFKLIGNLKNSSFKTNVMRECKEVFYDEKFLKKLDKNAWLIGFKNGVYDLKNHYFRPGIPEDYISLQMPIEYSEYSEEHHLVKEVINFLEKIFPDRDIRDYFINISSDVFVGGNQKKHVLFWSGEGDNGKSVTQTFFEKMLGEYAIKLPTSLIVGKRSMSSAASPELVRAGNGVRWAILQEPDKKDVINIGILKELSGNDSFYARGLFQNGEEIEPMFKLVVICNDPPSIPYSDKATWNRIRVIPFESTFVNNAPDTVEEQLLHKRFPKDPYFMEKIPDMIKPFAWFLLNHRKKGYKLIEPEKVTMATELYRKKNDIYRQFIDERIIDDPRSKISIDEIYTGFKDWFKESNPGQQVPPKSDVREYCTRSWGDPEKRRTWHGKRSISLDDEKTDLLELNDEDLNN
jgi:P4 family phage/plasmid primase-like protien